MSAPTQNKSPAPVTMPTHASSSARKRSHAALRSRRSSALIALRTSGRFYVIVATWPSRLYRTVSAIGFLLADVDEPGEPDGPERVLQARGHEREPVEQQDHAEDGQQRRRHQRDHARVALHPVERRREPTHAQAHEEERQPEPQRVGDEQRRATPRVALRGRDREHGGEDGPEDRKSVV